MRHWWILSCVGALVLLRPYVGYSQVIYGTVRDNTTRMPLSGVRITLTAAQHTTLSRSDGSFVIRRSSSRTLSLPDTLYVRLPGYQPLHYVVRSVHDTLTLDIQLHTMSSHRRDAIYVEDTRAHSGSIATHNVVLIEGQELERSRGQTLGEALSHIPGIALLQTGVSIAKPVIRGLHSQRVVIVNAGVVQEGQQWGADHAPEIDPFSVQRIEVLRGAAGIEYGQGALGGVVRVQPYPLPHGTWFGGTTHIAAFSNNSQGAFSLTLEGGAVSIGEAGSCIHTFGEGFGWRVQGSARKAGDSRAPHYILSNTGFQELNGSLALGYTSERFTIEAYYALFTTELGILRGAHIGTLNDLQRAIEAGRPLVEYDWTYSIHNPKQQITHDLWSVHAQYKAPLGQFDIQYGWQQNNRAEFDSHNARIRGDSGLLLASLNRPAMTLQLTTYSLDTKFRHHAFTLSPTSIITGVLGASVATQWNIQGGRTLLIPSFYAESAGIYCIETLTTPHMILNAGIRYDIRHIRIRGSSSRNIPDTMQLFSGISAAWGVRYEFPQPTFTIQRSTVDMQTDTSTTTHDKHSTTLALNVGIAWRAPLVHEQFSLGVHHGAAQYEIGNSQLRPERSYSADITLSHTGNILRMEISAYAHAIADFIYSRPDAARPTVTIRGTFPTFFYTQTLAFLAGSELSLDAVLLAHPSNNMTWRMGGAASLVRGINISDAEPLIFMPADRMRMFTRLELPSLAEMTDVFCEFSSLLVRTQDRFPQNVDYTLPPHGYVLFDVSLGSTIHAFSTQLTWSITARNLLDTPFRDYLSRYRYFADDAGRNIIIRVSVPFGNHTH
ncbi:MAG: TonB-dependent receptor [Bacteroidota bacterium]|nr:TonB-dependent receptor [Candidatus Kapabacteria bacterium]MDW8219725.1 TonB-dependent receptor [Bacteroidota bacterium]